MFYINVKNIFYVTYFFNSFIVFEKWYYFFLLYLRIQDISIVFINGVCQYLPKKKIKLKANISKSATLTFKLKYKCTKKIV